jgi:hypothetical protein
MNTKIECVRRASLRGRPSDASIQNDSGLPQGSLRLRKRCCFSAFVSGMDEMWGELRSQGVLFFCRGTHTRCEKALASSMVPPADIVPPPLVEAHP